MPFDLPDHTSATAYRLATESEHYFSPESGDIIPGPSHDVVMVLTAEPGYAFHYSIASDKVEVAESAQAALAFHNHATAAASAASATPHPFAAICKLLLSGDARRARRQEWPSGRTIGLDPLHKPHFTDYRDTAAGELAQLWHYRTTDLSARDWVVVE